jgi:glycosyltransferase involved in cell wall biosynthesis
MYIPQKRIDLLLPVWQHLNAVLNDWEFHIVGSGRDEEIIKNQAATLQLERVYFHGRQNPVPFYQKAKVFCMTSAFEGFPNVVLEAQSFGCVPVAFNAYGAISEIVEDNKNALLVKPFDIKKMSEAILKIALDEPLYKDMSEDCLLNAAKYLTGNVGLIWLKMFREKGNMC